MNTIPIAIPWCTWWGWAWWRWPGGGQGPWTVPSKLFPFSKYYVRSIINTTTRVNYLSLPCSNYKRNKILEKNDLVVDHTKNIVGHVKLEEIDDFSETILYQDLWISWEWALKVPKPAVVHHLNLSSWRTARPINFGICFCRNQILVCPSFVMLWFCQIW